MVARSKLNSIEILTSQALTDLEISHEEYETIINEEKNYRRLQENIRMIKSEDELNEINDKKKIEINKINRENIGNA